MTFLGTRCSILLALALVTVGSGCSQKKDIWASESPAPAVPVRVVRTVSESRPATEEVIGTVRAKLRASIEAKVSARIEAMLVVPGQTVKRGELLAQLDAREIQAKLDQALAAREQASRDLTRAKDLWEKKITTQAEFDSAQARDRIASGAVREMETMLGYTRLLAPFDGIVTRKLSDVGDLASPGKPILEMEDPSALRFEADVPEALIGNVKLGAKLPVVVSPTAPPIDGIVAEMAPVADVGSRTFLVKLDLPEAKGIRSGQFGRVLVVTGTYDSLRVPLSALRSHGQMEMVFVAEGGRAHMRIVRTGKHDSGDVELLSGVVPGENVITEGLDQLHDEQAISLKP